jgi:hypothetical protein
MGQETPIGVVTGLYDRKKGYLMDRIEVFIKTDEDWYGNFKIEGDKRYEKDRFVRLSMSKLMGEPQMWRVAVWGNDDLGMDLDFQRKSEAKEMFSILALKGVINRKLLTRLGFNRF